MYKLKPLPYSYEALEPFIDTHTIGLHYHKHQQNYLNKLNELLQKNNYDYRYPVEELPLHINEFNEADRENILFNLGGVLNHDIYFNSMSPEHIIPVDGLMDKIVETFGSYDQFKTTFKNMALNLKGSGYTFLTIDQKGELGLINMYNQDTPYLYSLTPLLAIDVWEHAYYINYENKRDLYIDNFFQIMDYKLANEQFKEN